MFNTEAWQDAQAAAQQQDFPPSSEDAPQVAPQGQQGFLPASEYEPYMSASILEVLKGHSSDESFIQDFVRESFEAFKKSDFGREDHLRDMVNRAFNGDLEGGHGTEGGHGPGFTPGSEYDPGFIPSNEKDAMAAAIIGAMNRAFNGHLEGDYEPVHDVGEHVLNGDTEGEHGFEGG